MSSFLTQHVEGSASKTFANTTTIDSEAVHHEGRTYATGPTTPSTNRITTAMLGALRGMGNCVDRLWDGIWSLSDQELENQRLSRLSTHVYPL